MIAGVCGVVLVSMAVKIGGLPGRLLEATLIAAVLIPVWQHPAVQSRIRGLARPRLASVAAMFAFALLGQLALGTRLFPFINWNMYASSARFNGATVPAYEFDAVLRGGRRVALVPGRVLAIGSGDRISETLRRQVDRLRLASHGPRAEPLRGEHAATLGAIAHLYEEQHAGDRVVSVLVLERRVSVSSGEQSDPRVLWRISPR